MKLVVTQTPGKDHQLTLIWKTLVKKFKINSFDVFSDILLFKGDSISLVLGCGWLDEEYIKLIISLDVHNFLIHAFC